ncbi:TMAO reductase system sensor histidine kinase/response regulator TorS [Shewanella sp. SG41-4]|uniref:TMAO reductase system sensor histidine kinase/response regulator TorS n=1 Tax=Shewanella sp. SG41-4 TaxID=2760976 RepID=UPI0015FF2B5F|nr:TMAO reductase system sensor histidine kinase/response regulator TorS [Shewanella sp. SG41-4]
MSVSTLSLSGKSLVGRLMLAFCLLGLLLLMLVSLGSISLYWVKLADQYLYEEALPASEAARQLMQSSNGLLDNAQALERVEKEEQRVLLGRKLTLESTNLLSAIERLNSLNLQNHGADKDKQLAVLAGEIIQDLSIFGRLVGKRLVLTAQLSDKGRVLAEAASNSGVLLEAEQAVVDSTILAKLSLAYPQVVGAEKSAHLLDSIIEQDLDIRERLNRALALIHHIALVGQLLQSPEQQLGLNNVLDSMARVLSSTTFTIQTTSTNLQNGNEIPSPYTDSSTSGQIDLIPLELLKGLIRDPVRATDLEHQLIILREVNVGLILQQQYAQLLSQQNAQLLMLTDKLGQLNKSVDSAIKAQQQQAEHARSNFLQQLLWAKSGLWATGILMLIIMLLVVYRVVYKGIALRLSEATAALSQLSQGNIEVVLDPHGDDELTAMAAAIEAFKQKTTQNQALQAELQQTASELFAHKASLESTVKARTLELAETNRQLDAEAKGHSTARVMAEQANKAKSLFLATMSHEIRTPLNGLLGTLTLLSHSPLPPAQKQMLALSQYSGTLLQNVLNDILDFSRLEQGKLTNEPRAVALNELLDEVMSIMLAGAGLSGIALHLVCGDLPKWITVDGPKLRQVLFNLLGNAIKFTPAGEITLRVNVVDKRLTFEVADTGVGINEKAMEQLFIAYGAQPNQGRTRGTGLGLAICKELVSLMNEVDTANHSIWVNSKVDEGSIFGFSLPLHICEPVHEVICAQLPKVDSKCVLVIEDDKVNSMVAQGFLAHLGHHSVLADSCAQARALFNVDSALQFDGIMLDIQLGDGSGVGLLVELKDIANIVQKDISIAAFTAQIQDIDIKEYQTAGFDDVLAKPLNMKLLVNWIGDASDKSPMNNANMNKLSKLEQRTIFTHYPVDKKSSGCNEDNQSLLDENQINQDLQYLGTAAVKEMLALFQVSSTQHINTLAVLSADNVKVLHALKGSSASIGFIQLSQLCKQLEKDRIDDGSYHLLKQVWLASINALELKLIN